MNRSQFEKVSFVVFCIIVVPIVHEIYELPLQDRALPVVALLTAAYALRHLVHLPLMKRFPESLPSPTSCVGAYAWTCQVCESQNEASNMSSCAACHFPAVATGAEIEAAKRSGISKFKPYLPANHDR